MKQTSSSSILLCAIILQIALLLHAIKFVQSLTIMMSSTTTTKTTFPNTTPRVELFFSNSDELRKRITFLKSRGVTSFNLVNKSNKDDILESVNVIQDEFRKDDDNSDDNVSICAHYSMKYNKSRKMDGAFQQLKDYVENMKELGNPQNEILLITGSGPKGKLCSLTALQRLQKESIHNNSIVPSMAVAFNPFFPNKQDYEEEKSRLEQKLATGIVSKVYIQFGADLERLQSALQLLTTLQSATTTSSSSSSSTTALTAATKRFEICGSIFLPTKMLIAQQKFRPWNGVFLNDEFLSSEDGARRIVLQMMRLYEEYSSEILIEAPGVRSENDWDVVESLLKERDELLSSMGVDTGINVAENERNEDSAKVKDAGSRTSRDGETSSVTTTSKRRKTSPTAPMATTKVEQGDSSMKSNFPPTQFPSKILNDAAIVLFHSHDVRLHDNLALQMASHHKYVIPAFLWSKKEQ